MLFTFDYMAITFNIPDLNQDREKLYYQIHYDITLQYHINEFEWASETRSKLYTFMYTVNPRQKLTFGESEKKKLTAFLEALQKNPYELPKL